MEALSLIVHCIMKQLTFRFVGCGDTANEQESQKFISDDWNKSTDCHSFLYKHKQSSMTYSIKILKLGTKLLINGIALQQNSIFNIEVDISDFIPSNCSFEKISESYKSNIEDFIYKFWMQVAEKLFVTQPESKYNIDVSSSSTTSTSSSSTHSSSSKSSLGPIYPNPYNPYSNPSPLLVQPNPLAYPSPSPFSIGGNDLDPFSLPHPSFGGNLIGPQHPSFFAPQPNSSPFGRGRGRGGIKPPGVPPDARYDPFGPPSNPFGEPDNDHEFGPGGNMYL